jgi:aspartyl-tRNA(Asn)/glutamyl-tRNA(Gln) amidotransferase subunit B
VRRAGEPLGTRCEIKNLNSFRFIERAIEFEARRQIAVLEDGGRVEQETRLYDPERDETRAMRSKEEAHDYRYFPDPDLLPLVVSEEDIERVRASIPELPAARRQAFTALGVPAAQADLLTSSIELAAYATRALDGAPREHAATIANWITGPLSARLNDAGLDIGQSRVSAEQLRSLTDRIADGTLSGTMAKEVFDAIWAGEGTADQIIERRGLQQISDAGAIEKLVEEVVAANARLVEDYRGGKEKAFNALVGQVMKASRGKANPVQASKLLRARLDG